jgi:hypothetical protein
VLLLSVSCCVRAVVPSRGSDAVSAGDDGSFAPI